MHVGGESHASASLSPEKKPFANCTRGTQILTPVNKNEQQQIL
jgi:hypothetical protein